KRFEWVEIGNDSLTHFYAPSEPHARWKPFAELADHDPARVTCRQGDNTYPIGTRRTISCGRAGLGVGVMTATSECKRIGTVHGEPAAPGFITVSGSVWGGRNCTVAYE